MVQSAFKSFFRRQREFRFESDSSDGLWALLVVITLRKCAKWADVFTARKRAVSREVSLEVEGPHGTAWRDLAASEPGPEELAVLAETVDRLLQELEPRQQQIVSLRMEGYELDEIAQQVQSSRRTVSRVVAEAKKSLEKILANAGN